MAQVLKTAEAEDSLLAMGRYIARESQSLDRALLVLDRIDVKCRLYAQHPLIGQSREPTAAPSVQLATRSKHEVLSKLPS
jgi:plasmid stabilization system protein ParE